ncbi:MAG: glycosyltransferase involved in cell wall biosynthesis [Kiritimatiellia bacterium]|jgi:glycosyltransferase involved in cell wall biosynthesis
MAPPEERRDTQKPKVCLGMPLYNQTKHLPEALNSLLSQTYSDFRLIISDDSTEPGPAKIVNALAVKDPRITYYRNENRLGLVDNWRACFDLAGEGDYFAWVGDHDVWHANWLESLVKTLNAHEHVLLAYPKRTVIDEFGNLIDKNLKPGFSSLGLDEDQRAKSISLHAKGFGNMVYGLFRADALRRAGVFRKVIMPDVMLLLELSLQGDIYQVDETLWSRRQTDRFSIARQKKSLFVKKPWYILLPWPIVNACVLFWNTAIRPKNGTWQRKKLGLKLMLMYLLRWSSKLGQDSWLGSYRQWRRGTAPLMKKLTQYLRGRNEIGK